MTLTYMRRNCLRVTLRSNVSELQNDLQTHAPILCNFYPNIMYINPDTVLIRQDFPSVNVKPYPVTFLITVHNCVLTGV